MNQVLHIDDQTYISSSEAAAEFGYTNDYVSRLAREGKVAGERVRRQWYVSKDSLAAFVAEANQQKEERKELLRLERQHELRHHKLLTEAEALTPPKPVFALGQAVAVFMALVSTGGLYYHALSADLSVHDLQAGLTTVQSDVASAIVPNSQAALLGWVRSWLWGTPEVVTSQSSTASAEPVTTSVPAPVQPRPAEGLVLLDGESDAAAIEAVRSQFSDPVEVVFDDKDTGMVTPIFEERSNQSYRFLLVPVTTSDE